MLVKRADVVEVSRPRVMPLASCSTGGKRKRSGGEKREKEIEEREGEVGGRRLSSSFVLDWAVFE